MQDLGAHPDVRHLCLLAQPINRIDVTGLEVFAQLHADAGRGVKVRSACERAPRRWKQRCAKRGVLPAAGLVTTVQTPKHLWPCSNCRVAVNPVTHAPIALRKAGLLLHSNQL